MICSKGRPDVSSKGPVSQQLMFSQHNATCSFRNFPANDRDKAGDLRLNWADLDLSGRVELKDEVK